MKYREMYENQFQDKLDPNECCPAHYGYMSESTREGQLLEMCAYRKCAECWEQEAGDTPKTVVPVHKNMPKDYVQPTIKDSGDRTQFSTGAVRDMREGKGRFDISPLEVMSTLLGTDEFGNDPIIYNIAYFMYEQDTSLLETSLFQFADKAYNGCIPTMLLEVAIHFEQGAKKYGEANYRLGIPVKYYIDSAVRHYMKWLRGDEDEPHARSFVWNLLCCIWEVKYGHTWRDIERLRSTDERAPLHESH